LRDYPYYSLLQDVRNTIESVYDALTTIQAFELNIVERDMLKDLQIPNIDGYLLGSMSIYGPTAESTHIYNNTVYQMIRSVEGCIRRFQKVLQKLEEKYGKEYDSAFKEFSDILEEYRVRLEDIHRSLYRELG